MKAPLTANATVMDRTGDAAAPMQPISVSAAVSATQVQPPEASGRPAPKPVPRRPGKIPLEKGYSQMDWMRLSRTHPDLAGLKGEMPRRGITMEEVKKHKTKDDAWLVYAGKVYNVTPYLNFHPGGVDYLMLGAGKDATSLINKYHRWVNIDMMMNSCLVGLLQTRRPEPESQSNREGCH